YPSNHRRLQVADHNYLLAQQVFGLIVPGNACNQLSGFSTQVNSEFKQPVGTFYLLARSNFSNPQIQPPEFVNRNQLTHLNRLPSCKQNCRGSICRLYLDLTPEASREHTGIFPCAINKDIGL